MEWKESVSCVAGTNGVEIMVRCEDPKQGLIYLDQIETHSGKSAAPYIRKGLKDGTITCVTNKKAGKMKFFKQEDLDARVHLNPETWEQEPRDPHHYAREVK
jgi:hypothetical protein